MDVKNPFPLTKSTFKDIQFFGVLNWVTFHSQTEKKNVEIISTPRDAKVNHAWIFQIVFKGKRRNLPSHWEEWGGILVKARILSLEWSWPFKPFSKLKATFHKYWTSRKPKLVWPVGTFTLKYEVKIKIVQEQRLQLKMNFLLGYNMTIVI